MTRRLARVILLGWTMLPVGLVLWIVTGEWRFAALGAVAFCWATAWAAIAVEGAKQVKAKDNDQ